MRRKRGPDAAVVVAYIPEQLAVALRTRAAATRRTSSDLVARAVERFLESEAA